jgi:ActR/RegA family two-component response regulator
LVREDIVNEKILFVDDEVSILQGYQRLLHREFHVSSANSGDDGLAAIKTSGPFAVVISDMRMPGMNGAAFLAKVREMAPDTVRMLLTGYSDLEAAIDAVNNGHIFRYLTKPCEKEVLVKAIQSGLTQHQTIIADKELIRKAKLVTRSSLEWEAQDLSQGENVTDSQGLPGPSEAREYLDSLFGSDCKGHVVLIKLTILQIVEDRYGAEAASDYVRVTMKFLMHAMAPTDRLFHWSRDVLMLIVRRQLSSVATRMEIARLMQERRESITDATGRQIMVAAPTTFDLLPISAFPAFNEMLEAFDAKLTGKL